ncbi:hypothetical protein FAM18113_02767 [Lacticaseibacillus paracasei]|nr:hypothetical protein FAM18113_02767 [Lacticaseibacillus paracasei]
MTNTAIRYTPEFKQTLIDLHEKGKSTLFRTVC